MSLFTPRERAAVAAITKLVFTNPFSEQRLDVEKEILGKRAFQHYDPWHSRQGLLYVNPNLKHIDALAEQILEAVHSRWPRDPSCIQPEEMELWDLLVLYWLFEKYRVPMGELMRRPSPDTRYELYDGYLKEFHRHLLDVPRPAPCEFVPARVFAIYHQIQRAFDMIFDFIAGGSVAASQMRADIWQSIFTCDIQRYYRQTYAIMKNFTTLITGESGTGKELVARAIALSQYIPFVESTKSFQLSYRSGFSAVQLSAVPQTILESELFGHKKGSFTGAVDDHVGYLEACPPCGSIFLDEIGDISAEIQIKLLRVLQNRTFQRLGDTRPLEFQGKIIVATNRDLEEACMNNTFRRDLLFRICADTIRTAPLRQLLNHDEQELWHFVIVLAQRLLNGEEALRFADESAAWIAENLGMDYPWPGNVRELEQCLRNLLIRGRYTPPRKRTQPNPIDPLLQESPTAEQLLSRYLSALYEREGHNLAKTAKTAGLDRRTAFKYISKNGAAAEPL